MIMLGAMLVTRIYPRTTRTSILRTQFPHPLKALKPNGPTTENDWCSIRGKISRALRKVQYAESCCGLKPQTRGVSKQSIIYRSLFCYELALFYYLGAFKCGLIEESTRKRHCGTVCRVLNFHVRQRTRANKPILKPRQKNGQHKRDCGK